MIHVADILTGRCSMTRYVAVACGLLLSTSALACGGKKQTNVSDEAAATVHDPTHCARDTDLVGDNCSYSTGMMANRVLEEGKPYRFTGRLHRTENQPDSKVATPFKVGPAPHYHVVANEIVECLVEQTPQGDRVTLEGRVLEVDGIHYFVTTEFETSST